MTTRSARCHFLEVYQAHLTFSHMNLIITRIITEGRLRAPSSFRFARCAKVSEVRMVRSCCPVQPRGVIPWPESNAFRLHVGDLELVTTFIDLVLLRVFCSLVSARVWRSRVSQYAIT